MKSKSTESSHGVHRVADLWRCPQLYAYKHVLKLVPQYEKHALALGSLVHAGLECHYRNEAHWQDVIAGFDGDAEIKARAEVVLSGYFQAWPPKAEPFEVLDVEREFGVTLRGHLLTRRLDLIGVEKSGERRLVVLDHKTASNTRNRADSVDMDPTLFTQEIVGRAALAEAYGRPWGRVILNLIPTPGRGEREVYRKDFIRVPLHFTHAVISDAPRSLAFWLDYEDKLTRGSISPWEYPRSWACYARYGPCEYKALCTDGQVALCRFLPKE